MTLTSKMKVAVLRGGPSFDYDKSLKTGHHVLSILRESPENYDPIDIFISKDGEWHRDGLVHEPHHALKHVDVVWNGLHGAYGEDGQIQKILEAIRVPYTGSRAVSSVLSINKDMAKKVYKKHGLLTPQHEILTRSYTDAALINIFRNYLHPVIVKPVNGSGGAGIFRAHTFQELERIVGELIQHFPKIIVEEFVKGDDVTCGVLEQVRGERLYAFLPKSQILLTTNENKKVEELAKLAHEVLGLRHYSNSDFVLTPKKRLYILETNALPPLYEESQMHHMLRDTGWQFKDFVQHVLSLAI